MERRRFIKLAAASSIVGFAGCVDQVTGPRPSIEDTATNYGSFSGSIGRTTFRALLVNQGGRGEVRVTLTFLTENEVVIQDHSKIVTVGGDERRRVEFKVDVPNDADQYEVSAEAV
jgi:hypothetical protein